MNNIVLISGFFSVFDMFVFSHTERTSLQPIIVDIMAGLSSKQQTKKKTA